MYQAVEQQSHLFDGLVVFAFQETLGEVSHHHVAVQTACDFELAQMVFVARDGFNQDVWVGDAVLQQFFCCEQVLIRGKRKCWQIHQLHQYRAVYRTAFTVDDTASEHELLGDIGQLFAFQGFTIGFDAGVLQSQIQQELIQLKIVFEVALLLAMFGFIQRWLCNVDIATLNDFRHLTVEEGQEQGADVRAIDVGIGHDDDAVVAELVWVVFFFAYAAAQSGNQGGHFLAGEHFFKTGFFHVQNLAF